MIAVGGGGDGDICDAAAGLLCRAGQPRHRIGSAKRLEGPKPEAGGFILEHHPRDAKMRGHLGQIMKRRRRIAGPAADFIGGVLHHLPVKRSRRIGEGPRRMRRIGIECEPAGGGGHGQMIIHAHV